MLKAISEHQTQVMADAQRRWTQPISQTDENPPEVLERNKLTNTKRAPNLNFFRVRPEYVS
eukprot:2258636-Amphidinium_carterae.1